MQGWDIYFYTNNVSAFHLNNTNVFLQILAIIGYGRSKLMFSDNWKKLVYCTIEKTVHTIVQETSNSQI